MAVKVLHVSNCITCMSGKYEASINWLFHKENSLKVAMYYTQKYIESLIKLGIDSIVGLISRLLKSG